VIYPGVWASYLAAGLLPVLFSVWTAPLEALAGNQPLVDFLRYLPFLALAGAGVMGWKLNQTRVLVSSFLSLILYALLLWAGSLFSPATVPLVRDILAVGVPLSFALIVSGRECPLVDRRFVVHVVLAFLPFLVMAVSASWMQAGYHAVVDWAPLGWGRPLGLPWLAIAVIALYWIAVGLSGDRRIRNYAIALGLALVPAVFSIVSLNGLSGKPVAGLPGIHATTGFLAVSLILFHAVFSLYWHRVYMDDLTGVPNRRALEEELQNVSGNYAVAMIDIDHFKAYNDRFGHDEGDNVLRMVACHLESELLTRVYRYGGEEFCVVWPGGKSSGALTALEKARRSLEKRVFHVRQPRHEVGSLPPDSALGVAVGVTISAGFALPGVGVISPEVVVKMADEALYEAKRTGRNRTVVSPGA